MKILTQIKIFCMWKVITNLPYTISGMIHLFIIERQTEYYRYCNAAINAYIANPNITFFKGNK